MYATFLVRALSFAIILWQLGLWGEPASVGRSVSPQTAELSTQAFWEPLPRTPGSRRCDFLSLWGLGEAISYC